MNAIPEREEHHWEGAYRVPCVVRLGPAKIKPGSVSNEMVAPSRLACRTFLAMAGDADVNGQAL